MNILQFLGRRFIPTGNCDSDVNGEPFCHSTTDVSPHATQHQSDSSTKDASKTSSSTYYGDPVETTGTTTDQIPTVAATTATTSDSSLSTITSAPTTATATTSATSAAGSSGGGTSTSTKLAIAIPVAVVGALIIMGIIFFVLRRRRQQREQQPISKNLYEETSKNESNAISTSELMVAVPASQQNQREPGFPRFPMLDVPESRDGDISPAGSAGHASQNETHSEVGYGMAMSGDLRPNATESDHRVVSMSASPTNALESHVQAQRSVHETERADTVSVVSDLHEQTGARGQHYDDLSSVSSFDGDTPRADDHQHPFR